MNAEEARKLTKSNLSGPVIQKFIEALDRKIEDAARNGKSGFDPWLHLAGLRTPSPNGTQKDAIQRHYVALGYSFRDYPDPDPGHPCSRPYTMISWEIK